MKAALLRELRSRRYSIRIRWTALLRAEPVTTPLALPDALVHLIDSTLDEILMAVETGDVPDANVADPPHCPCGLNPLLAFFAAAKQAMREGLVLAQAASAPLDPATRDASLADLNAILERIACREIGAFCGVCQFREVGIRHPLLLTTTG